MKKVYYTLAVLAVMLPIPVFAAPRTLSALADLIIEHINAAVLLLVGATVLLYLYRSGRDLFSVGQGKADENIAKARKALLEGLGIIFVMVSVWGILNLIIASLKL